MKCVLCKERAAKRYCPGVQGYICAICCGQEREVSIECPFECPYLQQGHRFELEKKTPDTEPAFAQHDVPRQFVEENQAFIANMARVLLQNAQGTPRTDDSDLRAVLDSLIRTYETLSTGIVYETLPEGPTRVNFYRALQAFVEDWRKREAEQTGLTRLRDGDVLRSLVFLRRLAQVHDNGRPKGKLFYDYLRRMFPDQSQRPGQPMIVPGA